VQATLSSEKGSNSGPLIVLRLAELGKAQEWTWTFVPV